MQCLYPDLGINQETQKKKTEELPQTRRLFLSCDAGAGEHARAHAAPPSRHASLTHLDNNTTYIPHTYPTADVGDHDPPFGIICRPLQAKRSVWKAQYPKDETLSSVTLVRLAMQVRPDREDGEPTRGRVRAACGEEEGREDEDEGEDGLRGTVYIRCEGPAFRDFVQGRECTKGLFRGFKCRR